MENTPVKSFSKSKLSFHLPYLLKLQKDSWSQLWDKEIKELFEEMFPIRDYTGKQFELGFVGFKLEKPKYKNGDEARENDDTFDAPLRVRFSLKDLKTGEIKEQEVFLADFPLMTETGIFIINGVERVVIPQLIRSSGVFFTSRPFRSKNYFGAKIIPTRGAWLEFDTDASGFLGVKINRQRKVAATTLLRAFGLSEKSKIEKEFSAVDKGEIKYIEKTLSRDSATTPEEAFVEIYKKIRPGDLVSPDAAKDLVLNMFCNFQRYDLSKVGRWKMWERLGENIEQKPKENITKKERVLFLEDIILVVKEIIRLNNDPEGKPDQIDHLGNRRIRNLAELCAGRLRVGLMRMERIIKDRMSTLDAATITPSQVVNPKPMMAVIQEFFAASQFSQFMDAENPLAETEHKRRLTATGPGGLTRERAGFEVRDVQPSHYGRICPIQTPEGQNVGLINHLASFALVNPFGFLETPYFKVKKGRITDEVHYLTATQEERCNITHAGVDFDEKGMIKAEEVEARRKGEPRRVGKFNIDFIDVSSKQPLSIATSLIPFLQNDDANRALMGSNMQRQAVPLVMPQAPVVGTGVERNLALDSGEVVIAPDSGVISEVDAQHIKLKTKSEMLTFNLKNFQRRNQYTATHQRPAVAKGEHVKKGDVLVDGTAIDKGRLALGRNVFVAFLPFRGGNYEDAIVVSEKMVKEDIFTSIHIEDFTCDVRDTKLGPELTTCDIPNVSEDKLKDLDEEGIVRAGAEVGPNDILVGKISPKGEKVLTAEERLLKAIFGEKAKEVKDTSLRMEHGKRGRVVKVKIFSRDQGDKLEPGVLKRIKVEVAQIRKIKVGDKLAGRHGNKGVVGRILPEEEMPFLADGTPVDIVLNPLGVVSRMNLGQILETHLGWAATNLGYLAITPSLLGATELDIKQELRLAGLPESGQVTLYDGQTGLPFPGKITIGYMYMMKLIHMVEDKVHMRSIGPYSLITQQPLGGKAQFGGQRFGEMEVWALEAYGASHTLQEMLTIKSDDVPGRVATYETILKGESVKKPNLPASFNLLVSELKSLGLNVEVKGIFSDEEEEEAAKKEAKDEER
ncbi:MAG: DNA-directed RNA polymerase subunit beta [Candidatus Pacebacteria bacterium]|nr:DNA-directed RNA polymerase subunit beta [Candidatus Paceibacterota bacterium]